MELEQSKSHTGYLTQSTEETFLQSKGQYDDIQLNVDEGIMNNLFDTAWRSSNAVIVSLSIAEGITQYISS